MTRAKQVAKDWGGILTGIAALVGVIVTYVATVNQNDGTDHIGALQEAKLEKVYTLLTSAVEDVSSRQVENTRLIGDLREAVGELRGAIGHLNNRRVKRALEDAPALKAVGTVHEIVRMERRMGDGTRASPSRRPASMASGAVVQLPMGIEVEPETVQRKLVEIQEMKAAK